jgi:hypothetical protein
VHSAEENDASAIKPAILSGAQKVPKIQMREKVRKPDPD